MKGMISLQIKNGELTADVEFPVTENELRGSLNEINAPSGISASRSVFVNGLYQYPNKNTTVSIAHNGRCRFLLSGGCPVKAR